MHAADTFVFPRISDKLSYPSSYLKTEKSVFRTSPLTLSTFEPYTVAVFVARRPK